MLFPPAFVPIAVASIIALIITPLNIQMQQPSTSLSRHEPASFSFDNRQPHNADKDRSFSKCLRLKTNESFDGRSSHDMPHNQTRKSMSRARESQIAGEDCQRLAKEEYSLRTESLVKQYELRLSKQEEYYGLRQWKMKEQIQNLQNQTSLLAEQLRRARLTQKPAQDSCTLCRDGAILTQYNKVIHQNQQHHKNCLDEKRGLTRRVEELQTRNSTLEQQQEKASQEMRALNKQLRIARSKVNQLQIQKDAANQSVAELQRTWKSKLSKLQGESKQLQRQLFHKQNELSNLNVSKATESSTQSLLTNPYNSLKSSMLKGREARQDILGVEDRRNSLARRTAMQTRALRDIGNVSVGATYGKARVR